MTEASAITNAAAGDDDALAPTPKGVAVRLRACRAALGLTQREVAERIGVTRRSVWGWENGLAMPRESLPALAELYGRSVAWLLTGFDEADVDAVVQLRIEHDALQEMVVTMAEEVRAALKDLGAEIDRLRTQTLGGAGDESSDPER
jgi:transcriptional regulator with XRE-family HTH domain